MTVSVRGNIKMFDKVKGTLLASRAVLNCASAASIQFIDIAYKPCTQTETSTGFQFIKRLNKRKANTLSTYFQAGKYILINAFQMINRVALKTTHFLQQNISITSSLAQYRGISHG